MAFTANSTTSKYFHTSALDALFTGKRNLRKKEGVSHNHMKDREKQLGKEGIYPEVSSFHYSITQQTQALSASLQKSRI